MLPKDSSEKAPLPAIAEPRMWPFVRSSMAPYIGLQIFPIASDYRLLTENFVPY